MKTRKVSKFLIMLTCCALLFGLASVAVFADDSVLTTAEVEGLTIPVVGANPDFTVTAPDGAPYTFSYYADNMGNTLNVHWYNKYFDENLGEMVSQRLEADDEFEAGKIYYAEIIIQTNDGYTFAEDDLHVYYSDHEFDIDGYKGVSVTLTASFYVGDITEIIVIDLDTPVGGCTPDYSVIIPNDADYIVDNGTGEGWINGMIWSDITDPLNWIDLDEDDTFIEGHTYQLLIGIMPEAGHIIAEGACLTATVNGEPVTVRYPGNGVFLEMTFTAEKGNELIKNVAVKGLTFPKAGEKPDYSVTTASDAPYSVQNYMGEGWTNGMLWVDVTDEDPDKHVTLGKNDTFKSGHAYEVIVSVVPDEGYEMIYHENMTATLDCWEPEVNGGGEFVHLRYTFRVNDISEVFVNDIKTPVAGKKVDFYASVPEGAPYHTENVVGSDSWINGILWEDVTADKVLHLNDTFIEGHTYRLLIDLMPNNDDLEFSYPTLGFVNGENAIVNYPWGVRLEMVYVAAPAEETDYTNPFTDVTTADYFCEPVLWAVEENITTGMTPTSFGPEEGCTRAHAVTFLWRAAGCPEPASMNHPFTDVEKGSYYEKAVIWAVEKGITTGMTATTFGPDSNCLRPQIVTFLWRFAGKPDPITGEMPFVDVASDAYFLDAVKWAVENEITNGMSATEFGSEGECLRGQIVTFLYRYMVN